MCPSFNPPKDPSPGKSQNRQMEKPLCEKGHFRAVQGPLIQQQKAKFPKPHIKGPDREIASSWFTKVGDLKTKYHQA